MLSKSRYMAGLQCPKRLWYEVNARELVPGFGPATLAVFEQGHEVGRLAQRLYPGGVEIARDQRAWKSLVAATERVVRARKPVYEGAFTFDGGACRVDVLAPVEDGLWDLVEVKSTTQVKDEHVEDIAFQTWVLRGAGVPLRRSLLCHLDSGYVREGELELERLFALEDLTEEIEPVLARVPSQVRRLQETAAQPAHPPIDIGPHCSAPYGCPLVSVCWSDVPDLSVHELVRGGKKAWDLWQDGVVDLLRIPANVELTPLQAIQVAVARSGEPHVDPPALRGFLEDLEYPLHFLDFETYQLAIPPFDGTRPYQQIPFQFSLHVVEAAGAAARELAFLAESGSDPRPGFATALRDAIGPTGSIVVYNQSFEVARIRELVRDVPGAARGFEALVPRIVDLLEPFRKFHYLHPAQLGSASIKAVLPVLAGRGYEHLEIQEGDEASREFLRSLDPTTTPEERERIRAALLAYCGRDTEGMVEIVRALEALVA